MSLYVDKKQKAHSPFLSEALKDIWAAAGRRLSYFQMSGVISSAQNLSLEIAIINVTKRSHLETYSGFERIFSVDPVWQFQFHNSSFTNAPPFLPLWIQSRIGSPLSDQFSDRRHFGNWRSGHWDGGGSSASVFVLKWLDWVRATPLSNRDLLQHLKGGDISGRERWRWFDCYCEDKRAQNTKM